MVNKVSQRNRPAKGATSSAKKYAIPASPDTTPEMQEYFENRVRKTLRLNVVALKLGNLLNR